VTSTGKQDLYLSIGVTGHRDLVPAEIPDIEARLREFFSSLQSDFPDLPLQLITPLAEGSDQLAAEVALAMGISIVTVLPMAQSEYERDFSSETSIASFRRLLGLSDEVILLPPVAGDLESPYSEYERALQYAQLGVFTSDHCQVLLALWDGKLGESIGGTGHVVKYHLTGVMDGLEGDPTPAGLLADNENDLVHHVVCSRDRPEGEPEDRHLPGEAYWFGSRPEVERSAELPGLYRELLGRLQRFARDWHEKQDVIRKRSASLLNNMPELDEPSGSWLTDRLFRAADGLAVHYQLRVVSSLRAMHILAVLMGLIFLVYSEFDGPDYMVLTFLGLFLAGVVLYIIGNNHEWHRKYLDYRTLAEGLRVQLYWNLSGVVEKEWAGFAYDNFLLKQDPDLGWIRHVMRQASMYRLRGVSPDPAWLPWVISEWIGDSEGGQGQLNYYTRKEIQNSSRFRRTQRLGTLCLWVGIGTAILLYLSGPYASDEQQNLLLVLMGVLPLVAGIWDAYSHKKAEKELIKQYGFMRRVFTKAGRLTDGAVDADFQRQVLRALGQAALDEGAEWLLMHRERPLEHGRL
jgi:hypothetical protein